MRPEDETADAAPVLEPAVEGVEAAPGADASANGTAVEPDKKNWYIVKVQSGREDSIREAIERRVKIEGLEEFFGEIIVPVERYTTMVGGKRQTRTRKMFPGYIVANVEFNDRILVLFRETSGVGDFVGAGPNRAPQPMPAKEVERILIGQKGAAAGEKLVEQIKIPFEKGDRVRVRDGTFVGMEGEVKEILEPKDSKEAPRIRVELTIFGRPVPVEVEAWQVETV
jgi:transcriptional antiterminator NusG